jgi:hypothetical protein
MTIARDFRFIMHLHQLKKKKTLKQEQKEYHLIFVPINIGNLLIKNSGGVEPDVFKK